jgi:uncharacterized protein (TIGR02722 family)
VTSTWKRLLLTSGCCFVTLVIASGCAAFRTKVTDVDVDEDRHLDATYDYTDMRKITESVVNDLLSNKNLARTDYPPVVVIAGIENRTKNYVDTKSLSDRMRTMLLRSGKVQFVNAARREALLKEQGYQAGNATADTQVAIGRQIGAKYMLTGSFAQMQSGSTRQVRVSRKEVNYYKLTIEVTDLSSGLIVWTTEEEFAREARLPLIGW